MNKRLPREVLAEGRYFHAIDTWERSLDCLQPRGLMVSFGNASGPVTGVNLATLASKGSLYVTRPVLGAYVPTQETMQAAADEMFELVLQGAVLVLELVAPVHGGGELSRKRRLLHHAPNPRRPPQPSCRCGQRRRIR